MNEITRRDFLQGSLATAAALGLAPQGQAENEEPSNPDPSREIIDVHVSLGRWPFRRVSGDEPAELLAQLRRSGVSQAWAGSFEGLMHKDVAAVNARLAEICRQHGAGLLIPFGTVNPLLPDWEDDLRRCHEVHRMPGVRLHPNYHGYTPSDPAFSRLLELAAARGLIVQLVAWMEDERHHYRLMPVPTVDLTPLAGKAQAFPELRIVVTNGFRTAGERFLRDLLPLDNVYFDIAKLDVINGLGELLQRAPAERILFGSHAPLFYFESSLLKLSESLVTEEQARAICADNARRLLARGDEDSTR